MTQEKQSSFLFFFFSSEVLNDLEQTDGFHDIYRRKKKNLTCGLRVKEASAE